MPNAFSRSFLRSRESTSNEYSNAFSRRNPASEPPFIRKKNRHCIRKRKGKHEREIEIERKGEGAVKPNGFSQKTVPKPSFSR
jgi:hypothetical protein